MAITEESLKAVLEDDMGIDVTDIGPQTLLFSTGIIDSFALVTLMTYLEKEGKFRVDPADVNLENMDSIERILTYVERATSA
ncbi:MAG: acyl carrier protein [Alphaproteobacteria bacterium]|nr:acyl carrier protein [Alphaproteobacteria bacterium]MCB9931739.1 acyl carrier protein [Alphaproteobacteria bacterium]